MANDLSLLFQLRADNAQAKGVFADTRSDAAATAAQLRKVFGPEIAQTASTTGKIFSETLGDVENILQSFVENQLEQIPVVGSVLSKAGEGAKSAAEKADLAVNIVTNSISSLSAATGKSIPQLTSFLKTFGQLKTPAERNEAAFRMFGGSVDLIGNKTAKFLPELEKVSAAMASTAASSTTAAASLGRLAGPVALVVGALAVQAGVVVALTKEIFALAKASADYQGKLFDLSQQVGVSVETLSALEVAARTTGGSIDGLVQSLGIFQKKLEEAVEDRGSKSAKTLRQLGVDATDTEAALRQTIAALARMPEGFRQTALAMELFGRGGKAVLAIAKESQGDIDAVIDRLRGLGLVTEEQARLADEFNDQLVLLEVQLRGLGTQAIPVVLDVLRDLSQTLKENRDLFNILQGIVKAVALTISLPLKAALNAARIEFNKVEPILRTVVLLFERLKAAIEFISGHPITLPGVSSGASASPAETATKDQRDPFTEQLRDRIEAQKRLQAVLNVEQAKRQQQAEDAIALAQREFRAGKLTREQLLQVILANNRKKALAEVEALENDRRIKLAEQALAKDDLDKKTQLANAILAIDAQIVNKRAELERTAKDLTAASRLEERRDVLAHNQARAEIEIQLGQERIAVLEQQIETEEIAREKGLEEIEKIENATLVRRGQLLKRELELAGIGPERQVVLDKIKAIEVERTALERQQSERRKQLTRGEFESRRQILLEGLAALLQVEQIQGEARIATIKALADLGVKTQEQAAREILAIQLSLLDSEIAAVKTRQDAAKSIFDPKERRETQAQLANDLKVLNAQRAALQADGNREIDDARRQDLENERRYADELRSIRERIIDIQRDTARTVIDLMEANFARRRDIIRAEAELEIQEAEDRLRRNREGIRRERESVNDRLASLRGFLTSLEASNQIAIAAYARAVQARVDALNQQRELNNQERAELAQHQTLLAAIRERTAIGDFRSVIEARVRVLEQQRELNAAEQAELERHQEILQALREREARASQAGVLEARINVLQRQAVLNSEEQEELRRHQAELNRIREQDSDLTGAIQRRVDFLNSQKELNAQEQAELKQHIAILKVINEGGPSLEASIRARVEFLERQTELNAEEQAELKQHKAILDQLSDRSQSYTDAIRKRVEFLQRQKELNAEEKAELERHEKELELIRRRARLDEKEADPLGRITLDIDNLKEFARVLEDSIVPLADILRNSFLQVADAIGQTVANWVLLGETGPAVMRKILAQALASIAAEAAVNAIKELALGFATLFFNPAESAAHFTAAGLWASIAGVAAVAGRGVAGDLFKSAGAGAGGSGGSGGGSSSRSGQRDPIDLTRPQQNQEIHVFFHAEPGRAFREEVVRAVVSDVQSNGVMRDVIIKNGG